MAKKIIKEGKKKFMAVCSTCGCEFEYEMEDINCEVVTCPDCGRGVKHPDQREYIVTPTVTPFIYNDSTIYSSTELNCDECPYKPDPFNPVFGDSPCTFCRKNQVYCSSSKKE